MRLARRKVTQGKLCCTVMKTKVKFTCTELYTLKHRFYLGQYVIKPLKLIETISLENVLICPLTRAYFRSYRTQICVYVHLAEVPTCGRLKMLCWRGQTVGTAIWCLLMGSVPLQEVSVSGGPN